LAYQTKSEDGRHVATETNDRGTVEVAAAYDIAEDKFRYHVYVTPRNGERAKVPVESPWTNSLKDAFEEGMTAGRYSLPS
jgi:hypothetical protein